MRINSINPLHFIIGKADGYTGEKNRNKYLIFASTDKSKELLTKCTELQDEIKYLIKTINGKEYMKMKFSSYDNLPLNKVLNLHNLTTVARSVIQEDNNIAHKFF